MEAQTSLWREAPEGEVAVAGSRASEGFKKPHFPQKAPALYIEDKARDQGRVPVQAIENACFYARTKERKWFRLPV